MDIWYRWNLWKQYPRVPGNYEYLKSIWFDSLIYNFSICISKRFEIGESAFGFVQLISLLKDPEGCIRNGSHFIICTRKKMRVKTTQYQPCLFVRPASFWCLYCQLWTYFTPCSSVSIVNFEHVNATGYWKSVLKNFVKSQENVTWR